MKEKGATFHASVITLGLVGQLGEIEMANGDKHELARVMRESLMALVHPI